MYEMERVDAMSIGTRLWTWWKGELVGTDSFANRYYRERGTTPVRGAGIYSRERRWVIYEGEPEASRVPPEWHGWLHHTTDTPPPPGGLPKRPWQKAHEPNRTGTAAAYHPPGSLLKGGHRAPATGDYEPWTPS
jgi:NADH:ubiquinone oxidoreductase subunit